MKHYGIRELDKRFKEAEKAIGSPIYKILMEKDSKRFSYEKLLEKLFEINPNVYGTYDAHTVRKKLQAKKVDSQLIGDLKLVLQIKDDENDYSHDIAAYRYYKQVAYLKSHGKKSQEKKADILSGICDEIEKSKDGVMGAIIYDSFRPQKYMYNGIICDSEMYDEFMKKEILLDKLKKIILIDECFPEEVENFLARFKFNEDENEELEKINVRIEHV